MGSVQLTEVGEGGHRIEAAVFEVLVFFCIVWHMHSGDTLYFLHLLPIHPRLQRHSTYIAHVRIIDQKRNSGQVLPICRFAFSRVALLGRCKVDEYQPHPYQPTSI